MKAITKYLVAFLVLLAVVFGGVIVIKFLIALFLRSLTTTLKIYLGLMLVAAVVIFVVFRGFGRKR